MDKLSEAIKKRVSCRTYSDKPIEENIRRQLEAIVKAAHEGPFGNRPKFKLLSMETVTPAQWKKMGTYGVIKGARIFLAGIIRPGHMAMTDYGYCKEKIILQATLLGLGTCWLGGTFQSDFFAQAAGLQPGALMPTVTPLGYPASQKSLTEKLMRRFAGSDQRKPWKDIFFADDFSRPLPENAAGRYRAALENLRLAPSASNKQPWRVLYNAEKKVFHFFLERSQQYKMMGIAHLQDIDLGIAMSHFEITAREMGLKGSWSIKKDMPQEKMREYMVSWQEAEKN
ncbi:MAG TPA: nitroreductase family protein [Smithellaceae bacterium]|nr:nitroreductase family protein [Smithellaceae bacterium]HRS89242.1 nitroreductase family protein [Smithellaceae bacterium]HRV26300.1 nitroreductase family protein [Smithellaceae bacterium]